MRPLSSVAAFIARYIERDDAPDAEQLTAAAIFAGLDAEARCVIQSQTRPLTQRRDWLRERTGIEWSAAQLTHAEHRAFVLVRRELQRRGLWRD